MDIPIAYTGTMRDGATTIYVEDWCDAVAARSVFTHNISVMKLKIVLTEKMKCFVTFNYVLMDAHVCRIAWHVILMYLILFLYHLLNSLSMYLSFTHICRFQRSTIFAHTEIYHFFNLSGNQIIHICDSVKDSCMAFRNMFMLDLSHNHIKILQSYCLNFFKSLRVIFLAYNPLEILQRYILRYIISTFNRPMWGI